MTSSAPSARDRAATATSTRLAFSTGSTTVSRPTAGSPVPPDLHACGNHYIRYEASGVLFCVARAPWFVAGRGDQAYASVWPGTAIIACVVLADPEAGPVLYSFSLGLVAAVNPYGCCGPGRMGCISVGGGHSGSVLSVWRTGGVIR